MVAFQVARGAKRHGHAVEAWFTEPIESAELMRKYAEEQIPTRSTPNLKPLEMRKVLRGVVGLAKEVRKRRVRSVNLHNPGNTILATDVLACRLGGVQKVICSVHHPLPLDELPRSWKASTRLAGRLADAVVVTTPVLQDQVLQMGVPRNKAQVAWLAVEPPRREVSRAVARQELGIEPDAFVVGALGRLVAYKRFDALIRACSQSPAFMSNGLLLIAGGGEEADPLKKLGAELLGMRCRMLGYVEDSSAFYPSLDLFALPSELEGFGLVYVEAAMAGVPSIGCNSGGTPYAIHDGKTGLLLPPNDLGALPSLIESLAHDTPRLHALGECARKTALREFSISAFEARYLEHLGLQG